MESTRDIKGRIKSVTNIQQITKAMKMVAAARLRKAEEKANGSRPYAEKIGELLRRASSVTPGFTSPLFRTGEVKKVGYLVICGDKGLAGAYNSNVMKRTLQEISGKDRSAYALYVCGKQAKNYLKFRGYDPDTYHFGFSDKPSAQDSIDLSKEMVEYFTKEEVDEVYIIYTKFITALRQQVQVDRLLPIEAQAEGKRKKQQKRLPANGKKKDRISSVSRKIPIFSFPMRRQCFLNCFLNIYKYRFIMRCCNPRRPSWAAVWRPCPLPLTTRRKELPTSTLRTTKRVRHRSPMKFPKLSAVRQLSNKPA